MKVDEPGPLPDEATLRLGPPLRDQLGVGRNDLTTGQVAVVGAGVVSSLDATVENGDDLLGELIDDPEPFGDGSGHRSIEVGDGVVRSGRWPGSFHETLRLFLVGLHVVSYRPHREAG